MNIGVFENPHFFWLDAWQTPTFWILSISRINIFIISSRSLAWTITFYNVGLRKSHRKEGRFSMRKVFCLIGDRHRRGTSTISKSICRKIVWKSGYDYRLVKRYKHSDCDLFASLWEWRSFYLHASKRSTINNGVYCCLGHMASN